MKTKAKKQATLDLQPVYERLVEKLTAQGEPLTRAFATFLYNEVQQDVLARALTQKFSFSGLTYSINSLGKMEVSVIVTNQVGKIYGVLLKISGSHDYAEVIDYSCSCEDFYHRKRPCKHITAFLLDFLDISLQ